MTGGAIPHMERGARNVTRRTAEDICRAYRVNLDWLLNGEEPMLEDALSAEESSAPTPQKWRAIAVKFAKPMIYIG